MKTLLIETNQSCNFRCKYCFYNDYGRQNEIISAIQFENILKKENPHSVFLTGGEVTESEFFYDYINLCFSKNIKLSIFTNGWKILNLDDISLYSLLDKLNILIISLDSCNKNYSIRPFQNELFIKLSNLKDKFKDKIKIKISVNAFNINTFEETIVNLIEIGIKNLSINIVHNINSSSRNFELSLQDIHNLFNIIDKYIIYFDEKYIGYLKQFYLFDKKTIKCCANKTFKFYNCKCEEYPCPSNYKSDFNCLSKECICLWEMFYEE